MANPVLKVILQAVDNVTDVAKKAQESVSSFTDRAKAALSTLGAVAAGIGLGAFFRSAIEEASAAEVGMGRLGIAVRNAGGDFGKLKPELEKTVDSVVRLTKYTDDDLRAALTNMVAISGDVVGSQKNLALAADLAAFKHISLEEAATVVAKAMNGNVTAFNKLGIAGKDANGVLDSARASFGGFAANEGATFSGRIAQVNNQWGEFQEAVGAAIIGNDSARESIGKLAGFLADMAKWVEANEEPIGRVTDAIVSMGFQVVVAGGAIWDSLRPALQVVIVPLKLLLSGVQTLSYGFGLLAQTVKFTSGDVLHALGTLIGRGANLLKAFGISVGTETAQSLREAGERMKTEAVFGVEKVRAVFSDGMDALWKDRKSGLARIESSESDHGDRRTRIAEANAKEQARIAREEAAERERIFAAAYKAIENAQGQLTLKTVESSQAWAQLDREAKKAAATISLTKDEQAQLSGHARATANAQKDATDSAESAQHSFSETVDSAASLGLSLISAASGMGRLSDEAASALTSVINMGASIAKFGLGSPQGLVSIIGGLAQLIGGWGSSAVESARREALGKNSDAIAKLTREIGNFNLGTSGRTFQGITDVFSGLGDRATALQGESSTRRMAGALALQADIKKMLLKKGISQKEAEDLFSQIGAPDLSKIFSTNDASLILKLVPQIIAALNATEFGAFGSNFEDQLQALQEGFTVFGTTDEDNKLAEFAKLASKFSPALAEALSGDLSTPEGRAAATKQLQGLFERLRSGSLSASEIGVSGPQFLSLITSILPLLAGANGVLQNGTSAAGPSTIGDTRGGPFGAPGLPALFVPTLDVPTPTWAADVFNGTRSPAMSIAGGVHTANTFNIYQREGEDLEELARRISGLVDETMALRYDSSRAARGVLPDAA